MPDGFDRAIQVPERWRDLGGELSAAVGQRDRTTRALEEHGSEVALEPADPAAEGRLGDAQALGRVAKVQIGGESLEAA